MPADKKSPAPAPAAAAVDAVDAADAAAIDAVIEEERSEKILQAKELYSHGSRNYLMKSYAEAADELSQVCALYEELYGELSDELGMPYLLYAKSLIALALDENKVIDVPDEEEEADDDDDDDGGEEDGGDQKKDVIAANGNASAVPSSRNGVGAKLDAIKEVADGGKKSNEADSTANDGDDVSKTKSEEKSSEEVQVSSTDDGNKCTKKGDTNGAGDVAPVLDGEKPSTSNGQAEHCDQGEEEEEEENEAASSLQLAWEILELAAKIFSRQGMGGLPNLAEVQTELANIEFENNILDAAREDYEKALNIYLDLPTNYRRAMAEIHYKIGLTCLMQQLNKDGAESLKEACSLIEEEIDEMKAKPVLNEKDKSNIQDMEETKQEIWAKIDEIEETQAQNVEKVRAALDIYKKSIAKDNPAGAGTSSSAVASSSAITSSSKPNDISHLIKRKKPEEPSSEAEAAESPAKRPAP